MKAIIQIAIQTALIATLFLSGFSNKNISRGEFRIPLDESGSGIMEYFEEAISFTVGDTTSIQENDESLGRKIAGWLYMITEKY